GAGLGVVTKMLGGVRVILGFALGRRDQYGKAFVAGCLQIGARTVSGVRDGQGFRCVGRAEIGLGLFNQGYDLTVVVLLPRGFTGHNDLLLFVGHGLGVIGVTVGVAHFHSARFRFNGMIMITAVGLELRQPLFDFLMQGFA